MSNPIKYTDLVEADALHKVAEDAEKALKVIHSAISAIDTLTAKQKAEAKTGNKSAGNDNLSNVKKHEEDLIKIMEAKVAAIQKADDAHKKYLQTQFVLKKLQAESLELENKITNAKLKSDKIALDQLKQEEKLQTAVKKSREDEIKGRAKNAEQIRKEGSAYEILVKKYRDLTKSQKDLSVEGKETSATFLANKTALDAMRESIDHAEHGVKEFYRNVGNYPQQLRDMQKELMGLEPGTKQFEELSKKAGALKDKIGDAKDSVKAFATDSKLTTGKTLFSQIGSDLADMNFSDAADKARQFAGIIKSISLTEVIGGVKNFASAIGNIGKALLLNPLVLFTAAIAGIGYAIYDTITAFNDFGDASKTLNESLKESESRVEKLGEKQAEYLIKLAVAQGKLTKAQGEAKQGELKNYLERQELVKNYSENVKKLAVELDLSLADTQNGRFKENYTGDYKEQLRRIKFNRDIEKLQANHKQEMGFLIKEQILEGKVSKTDAANEEKKNQEKANKETVEEQKKLNKELQKLSKDKIKQSGQEWVIEEDAKERQREVEAANLENKSLAEYREAENLRKENERLDNEEFQARWNKQVEDIENDKRIAKEKKRIAQEERDAVIGFINEAASAKNAATEKQLNNDLEMRQRNIQQQQALAMAGKDNTLAYEKAEAAKDELKKIELAKKEEKRAKRMVFIKFLSSYIDKDADSATSKAMVSTAIADAVAGSYFEGTENVGEDLKGNKVHNGRDGYRIAVDGTEAILNGADNKKRGDMSNADLVQLAYDYQHGLLPKHITESVNGSFAENAMNSMMLKEFTEMNKRMMSLERTLRDRPVPNVELSQLGHVIKTEVINGLTKTVNVRPPNNFI